MEFKAVNSLISATNNPIIKYGFFGGRYVWVENVPLPLNSLIRKVDSIYQSTPFEQRDAPFIQEMQQVVAQIKAIDNEPGPKHLNLLWRMLHAIRQAFTGSARKRKQLLKKLDRTIEERVIELASFAEEKRRLLHSYTCFSSPFPVIENDQGYLIEKEGKRVLCYKYTDDKLKEEPIERILQYGHPLFPPVIEGKILVFNQPEYAIYSRLIKLCGTYKKISLEQAQSNEEGEFKISLRENAYYFSVRSNGSLKTSTRMSSYILNLLSRIGF